MTLNEQQKKDIKDQQNQKNETKRVTAPNLEKILYSGCG